MRPPSPAGATPGTSPTSVFLPDSPSIRVIVASSREETSRSPSGSGARPHGVFSPSATVRTTLTDPCAGGVSSDAFPVDGEPVVLLGAAAVPPPGDPPSSEEQAAVSRSAAVAIAAVTTRRCTILVPSTRRVLLFLHRSRLTGSRSMNLQSEATPSRPVSSWPPGFGLVPDCGHGLALA